MVKRATKSSPKTGRSAADFLPAKRTLPSLRRAAAGCRGCDLYERGTQTVFGEGSSGARVMLVGEQPGDVEDREGRPFVGPAGRLLDRALADAGIERRDTYVTNAVKHFKWRPSGKRRIHEKPGAREVRACEPWLDSEIDVVGPRVIVSLGVTAGRALAGPGFRLTENRGRVLRSRTGHPLVSTVHPSALLRAPDAKSRRMAYRDFVADLRRVRNRRDK